MNKQRWQNRIPLFGTKVKCLSITSKQWREKFTVKPSCTKNKPRHSQWFGYAVVSMSEMSSPSGRFKRWLFRDGLILWHKHLHECPGDEIGNGAIAEDNHVTSRFACHTEELESLALLLGMGEEEA